MTNVLSYASPGTKGRPVVGYVLARVAYGIFGVMVPAGCFLLAWQRTPLSPEWQDGTFGSHVAILLNGQTGWVFYPLLTYAMLAMVGLIAWPWLVEKYVAVRMGIYGGVVVAFWYSLVMGATLFKPDGWWRYPELVLMAGLIAAAAAVPVGIVAGFRWVKNKWGTKAAWIGLAIVLALFLSGAGTLALLAWAMQEPGFAILAIFLTMGGGPVYALAAYLGAAVETWRRSRGYGSWRDSGIMAFFWWLLFGDTVAVAIINMLEDYSKLPTRPPHCYVCAAAARGHSWVVGVGDCVEIGGERVRVNEQMRVLKAGELALMTAWPRVHRGCRWVYDRVGPRLARMMVWPVAADGAYLAMKPVEWLVRGVMRRGVKDFDRVVEKLYA